MLLNPNTEEQLLKKLTTASNTKILKSYLDTFDKTFHIKEEKSKIKVAVLIKLFAEKCRLINPSVRDNLSLCMENICQYYGIDTPTFRKVQIDTYIDKDTQRTLREVCLSKHVDYWRMISPIKSFR